MLKGSLNTGARGAWFRKGLVVFQFGASIVLIIGTVVVYNQLSYISCLDYLKAYFAPVFDAQPMNGEFLSSCTNLRGVQPALFETFSPPYSAGPSFGAVLLAIQAIFPWVWAPMWVYQSASKCLRCPGGRVLA